jgi:hypothetical protein
MEVAREYEGTWEEIAEHADELAGRRVHLTVFPEPQKAPEPASALRPAHGPSTAKSILQYAGTWEGDDLEECLELVYATRSKAKF